jgi:hypothetical protein
MMPSATSNWNYVIAAYAVAWIAVIGYWVFVHSAVRTARARYEQALASLARAQGNAQ